MNILPKLYEAEIKFSTYFNVVFSSFSCTQRSFFNNKKLENNRKKLKSFKENLKIYERKEIKMLISCPMAAIGMKKDELSSIIFSSFRDKFVS
jgi:hypothetical protein